MSRILAVLALLVAVVQAFAPASAALAASSVRRADAAMMARPAKGKVNPALFSTGIAPKGRKTGGRKMSGFGGRTMFEGQKFGKDGAVTFRKPWEQSTKDAIANARRFETSAKLGGKTRPGADGGFLPSLLNVRGGRSKGK
jgi:hypothetical protein